MNKLQRNQKSNVPNHVIFVTLRKEKITRNEMLSSTGDDVHS